MTDENRRANVTAELEAADRTHVAAERNAGMGEYETAVNRLYYAVFHLARAVCLTEGLEPKTHRGLKQLFSLHFIATGLLPEWTGATLAKLETERDLADYVAAYRVSAERYEERRAAADLLLDALRAYLKLHGWA